MRRSFTRRQRAASVIRASICRLPSAIALTLAAVAASAETMQLEHVFDMRWATSPLVSADGDTVFYLRNSMDIMKDRRRANLWRVDADGDNHEPITTGARSISSPALSPDGERVAYVDKDDVGSQIFVQWLESGAVAQLTRGGQSPRNLTWSPDGRYIAFSMRVTVDAATMGTLPAAPKGAEWAPPPVVVDRMVYRNDGAGNRPRAFYQLFVVPADGGTPRQLTDGPYDHSGRLAWSGDGSAIYLSANRNDDREMNVSNSDLYRVAVADGSIEQLTTRQGPDSSPAISPDGKRLSYLGFDDERMSHSISRLYVMDLESGDVSELLPDLDRSIQSPQWSGDGRRIFFRYDTEGDTVLASTDLRGRMTTLAKGLGGTSLGRPYSGAAFAVGGDDRYAVTLGTLQTPADIATGVGGGKLARLTNLNETGLGSLELAAVEERRIESSADGERIQAWVAFPPGFDASKKYPLILEIHGGPHTNYGSRFSSEVQLYAAAGYVVLYVNPRGSTSYGARFANLIHHNYPNEDYDDLISAVDAVIEEGYVDPDQLYVTGGSGGGVLTAWIVGTTDRFRAAVVAKPVINWTSFSLTADNAPYFTQYWFPAMPWDDPEGYWKRSPLSRVGNVSTPTMLLTGESDLRTPISETEQYYQALRLRGIDTAMVRIPGASHSIAKRPSQLMAKVAAILEWFDRYAPDSEDGASES